MQNLEVVVDETEALNILFKSALQRSSNGDKDAQYYLANVYLFGWGVPLDVEKGWHYCELAANNGSKYAMSVMLWHYLEIGQLEKAQTIIKRAADIIYSVYDWDRAIPNAIQKYGCNVENILKEFQKDDEKEILYVHIAICYIYGLGVDKDLKKASFLLKSYLERIEDESEALQYQAMLACMIEIDNAVEIFKKIANYSQIMCSSDPTCTMRCVIKGASYGIRECAREVGFMFSQLATHAYSNQILIRSDLEAVKWFGLAGQLGDEECQEFEAVCYGDEESDAYNLELAKQKNMVMINTPQLRGLGIIGLAGNYQQEGNYTKEFEILHPYAKEGNAVSQTEIGRLLYLGKGVAENKEEAIYWWQLAAQSGNEEAIGYLKDLEEEQRKRDDKGGCYIATAVFGSYDCPEVWVLRRFRDYQLAQTCLGRIFIKIYYAISPTLVRYFGQTKIFCYFWRKLLNRMIDILKAKGYKDSPYNDNL